MAIDVSALVSIIQNAKCTVRLKVKRYPEPEAWGNGALIPVRNYIEVTGPWPVREVEWLEINPIVLEYIGRLVAPRRVDSLEQIELKLSQAKLLYVVLDGIIRVPFLTTS